MKFVSVREINAQLLNVAQFLLTVGGTFVFTFKAIEYSVDEDNQPPVAGKVCHAFLHTSL